jgi:hypothetical protein
VEQRSRGRTTNRLKTVKRPIYGRGGFVLLRARVVYVARSRETMKIDEELAWAASSKVRKNPNLAETDM